MPDRKLDPHDAYWSGKLDELRARRAFAAEMGGPDNVARQHDAGRLTVRERIAAIANTGSFREVGTLAGTGEYDVDLNLKRVTPATYVAGTARIDGRTVAIGGEDFTVRGGTSQVFAAGPPVVKRSLGQTINKEDLGGPAVAVNKAGSVHNVADTEEDAFDQIRRFLGYMPRNVWELPPSLPVSDPVDRCDEELLGIVPGKRTQPYDTAEALAVEEIIDPRETRPLLCEYIALAQDRLRIGLGPRSRAGVAP